MSTSQLTSQLIFFLNSFSWDWKLHYISVCMILFRLVSAFFSGAFINQCSTSCSIYQPPTTSAIIRYSRDNEVFVFFTRVEHQLQGAITVRRKELVSKQRPFCETEQNLEANPSIFVCQTLVMIRYKPCFFSSKA